MKNCPDCSKPCVVSFALRPEDWPTNLFYYVCSSCTWEEQTAVAKDMNGSYMRDRLNRTVFDILYSEGPAKPKIHILPEK